MIDLVMLIDDNETDNFISKRIIELTQFARNVVAKSSGQSALEYLQKHQDQPEHLPNLIFLDINMPIVDGFMFLYEFENFPATVRDKCKVVILSSSDNQRDINRLINNNHVVKYITKPLTQVALEEIKTL
ncbi:response regulator [Catalinimonas sp. 4WD22]|uniref:response regulator n=1 Tax=Catalinimonas locisalis TaxID=3133978 RepID=UPI0031019CA0